MKRILSTTGREKIEATAISTALIVTLPREEKGPLSMMRGVRTRTINFEKVCEVNDMSRAFVSGKISLDEAIERLKEIHQFSFYPLPIRVFGYGLISGCCSFLDTPFFLDGCIAFVIGLFLGCLDIWLGKKKIPYFFGRFWVVLRQHVLPASFSRASPRRISAPSSSAASCRFCRV